ncbi:hypothetical protein Trydic_g18684 [Trypoxylus dichotomus]
MNLGTTNIAGACLGIVVQHCIDNWCILYKNGSFDEVKLLHNHVFSLAILQRVCCDTVNYKDMLVITLELCPCSKNSKQITHIKI